MTMSTTQILTPAPVRIYVAPEHTPPPQGFMKDPTADGTDWEAVENDLITQDGIVIMASRENTEITPLNSVFPIAAYRTAESHSVSFTTMDMALGTGEGKTDDYGTGLYNFLSAHGFLRDATPDENVLQPRTLADGQRRFALLVRGRTNLDVDTSAAGHTSAYTGGTIRRNPNDDNDDIEWHWPSCYAASSEFTTTSKDNPLGVNVRFAALRPSNGEPIATYRWNTKHIWGLEFLGAVPPHSMTEDGTTLAATTGIKFRMSARAGVTGTMTAQAEVWNENGVMRGNTRSIGTTTITATDGAEYTINFTAAGIQNRANAASPGETVRILLDFGPWQDDKQEISRTLIVD